MRQDPSQDYAQGGLAGLAGYIRDNPWSRIAAVTIAFVAADVAMSGLPAGRHGSILEVAMVAVVLACLAVAIVSRRWLSIGLTLFWLLATFLRI